MALKPDGLLALTFGMVLAIAVSTMWLAPLNPESDSVAPMPPRETTYRPEDWRVYSARSPRSVGAAPARHGCPDGRFSSGRLCKRKCPGYALSARGVFHA
jgi:hypothetical protein